MIKKIIDLSKTIHDGLKGPMSEVKILQEMTRQWSGRHFQKPCEGWESRKIIISEHCGTHVDAPYHFVPNTKTLDQIPIDMYLGEAILLDLREIQKSGEPTKKEHLFKVSDRDKLTINKGDIVILLSNLDSKGLTKDAVKWLIEKGIKGVGTNIFIEEDIEEEGLKVRYAHVNFLSNNIPIFEDLINLEKITSKKFYFIGLPLKIDKGTGSPIRAIAIINE